MKKWIILAIAFITTQGMRGIPVGKMQLEYCHIPNYSQEVLCGQHLVYEDREKASGRQLEIKFAIIPAVTEAKDPDPLVMFAGGPGQGAREMGAFVAISFDQINENRDVVLIDQRGMGESDPLDCEIPEDIALSMTEEQQLELTRKILKECLAELDADVTKYNQHIANQDIHEILMALGYEKVNLYGVSWGTRSALLYANQFPEQVRSIIMDGNAPIENKVPLYATEDAEQSLQALFRDCAADKACQKAYPDLAEDFQKVLDAFGDSGREVTINNANTGEAQNFTLTRNVFVNIIRNILYVPEFSRLIPIIIEQAKDNNYQALSGLSAAFGDGAMAIGATLTILCSEELARINPEEIQAASQKGFVKSSFLNQFIQMCDQWPRAPLPEIYHQTLSSQAPTLILSGEIDPVTPAKWGDKMAEHMTNSLHLVAPNTGHNVAPKGCTSKLMAQFVEQANFENIEPGCLQELQRPSFFIDGSGPSRGVNHD